MRELRQLATLVPSPRADWVRTRVLALLALCAFPVLASLVYGAFVRHDAKLSHDEAEHLHVVFALERGEVPYRDFIENHPVLPHALLSELARGLGLGSSGEVYTLAKLIVLAHFLGCMLLLFSFLSRYRQRLGLRLPPPLTFVLVLCLLGVWRTTGELSGSFTFLWEVRPDWICHFWTLVALLLAIEALLASERRRSMLLAVCGGVCAGGATALMAKSVLLLVPAALALMLTAARWARAHRGGRRQLLHALQLTAGFIFAAALMFTICVAVELAVTGASLQEYWAANVLLNSMKHPVQVAEDLAPANMLRGISGLGLPAALAMTVLGFALAGHAMRKRRWLRYGVFSFAGIQLLFSICLPAFSNGSSWPQYFMPAMLTMLVAFVLMLDVLVVATFSTRLLPLWQPGRSASFALRWAPALLLTLTLAGLLLDRALEAQLRLDEQAFLARQSQALYGSAAPGALPDQVLPDDLSYLVFAPQSKPLRARAWGYFFMLLPDRRFWQDNHSLGLGPDPKTYWRVLFMRQPPDAILVKNTRELRERIRVARRAQDVDLTWLDAATRSGYECVTRLGVSLQIRHALKERFAYLGFKSCRSDIELPEWL